jgi:protein SCO1/2
MDFSLTDGTGRTVTRAEVEGKILVVSFLFTSCSLTCPEVTKRMAEIQRRTADLPDVRLLSLTVDPRSDTPPVLARWGARFGADTNRWFMLTGNKALLHEVIGTSFLAVETNNPFLSMPGNFAGTDHIALVDKHGRLRAFFNGLRLQTPAVVVAEIEKLRKEN